MRSPFHPPPLLGRALLLLAVFALAELAGGRACTDFLSGTAAGPGDLPRAFFGLFYLLSYLGAVVLAPALLIAAGLGVCVRRWCVWSAAA